MPAYTRIQRVPTRPRIMGSRHPASFACWIVKIPSCASLSAATRSSGFMAEASRPGETPPNLRGSPRHTRTEPRRLELPIEPAWLTASDAHPATQVASSLQAFDDGCVGLPAAFAHGLE